MKINRLFDSIFWFVKNPLKDTHMGFLPPAAVGLAKAAAPYAIPVGLSLAQGMFGKQQAKRDDKRMEEQLAQDKLIQAFTKQAQPQMPQQTSQPGIAQQVAGSDLTRKLLEELAETKLGIKPLGSV